MYSWDCFCIFSPPLALKSKDCKGCVRHPSAPVARPSPMQFCWELRRRMLLSINKDFEPGHSLEQMSFEDKRCSVCPTVCAGCQQGLHSPLSPCCLFPMQEHLFSTLLPKPRSEACAWLNRRATDRKSFWVPEVQFGAGERQIWYRSVDLKVNWN